jgi:membrane protease YdiL (CAAX protease family)
MFQFIRRHPLIAFFILAFAFAWSILIPLALSSYGLVAKPPDVLLLVMGYGPTLAAIAVSLVLGGRAEVGRLLRRLLIWRVGWGWWAITLFLNAAIILAALELYGLLGNDIPALPPLKPGLLLDVAVIFVLASLINGEEIGWRGFALPRLQQRYGIVATVGVLGVLESVFHLPIFLNNGPSEAGGQKGVPFAAFVVTSIFACSFSSGFTTTPAAAWSLPRATWSCDRRSTPSSEPSWLFTPQPAATKIQKGCPAGSAYT